MMGKRELTDAEFARMRQQGDVMSEAERQAALAEWIASRPECVQKLAAEFPLGSSFKVRGETLYLVGYNENDSLIVSRFNPAIDYEAATSSQQYLCASHCREGQVMPQASSPPAG